MIERKFVAQKIKEYQIQNYIADNLRNVGHSHTKMVKTPLGEKIVIFASRPGLIVGRKGENIKGLTQDLKKKFGLENPQIEISEVENINLDARIVAEKMTSSLERFGSEKFKAVGHKAMEDVMKAGAMGVEIIMSGKIPSSRAKSWRFYSGYIKKCGDVAVNQVDAAMAQAKLKSGVIGVKVNIMRPDTILPDRVEMVKFEEKTDTQEKKEEIVVVKEEIKEPKKRKSSKKTKEENEVKGN